ncbi:hypothetical protein [Stenotrophomonas oahuensis]|uniref:5'-3' exonuclease alpha-helical arch N-terminal domain-containing protein n=1 Tax=Stenotrophomonas oahuensis TaxID=3003271 RepID=A0ABY9YNF7_9GAMM|nr:hypothetical protein [Stenotrophomonas sp. A5586]WNH52438.1 hypothetical protein PDM29_19295 [Stenotrophomonas sp. A5586]
MVTPVTLLVDADIFAFAAASVAEKVYYWNGPEEEPSVVTYPDEAFAKARNDVEQVANDLKATRIVVCLTDDENFRYGVYPEYKGNRKSLRKPELLRAVKDFLAKEYETYKRPGLEADDCMGILSTHPTLIKGRKIVVSDDKDLKTIPGELHAPGKMKRGQVVKVSQWDADRYFMEQTLTGDSTDGYPGCKGIGAKSPYVTGLSDCKDIREMWALVKKGYESKGKTEGDALAQARCARILRADDWDFKAKKVRLWSPPVAR